MNRNRFFALLAGTAAASFAAVPAFAEGGPADKAKSAVAGEKANRGLAALAKRRAVQGELTKAVEGTAPVLTLTLETKRGDTMVVTTTADTQLRGKGHDDLTLAGLTSLKPGTRIIARGERDGDKLVAKHIIVRPAKEEKDDKDDAARRTVTVGTLGNITSTGFTVTPQGGSAVTFVANADTHYNFKGIVSLAEANGKSVRVVSKKDGTNNVALQVRYPAGA